MDNRKVIGILNAYDCRNRGDRAIVEAQIAWARRLWPDCEILVFSPHYRYNASVFGEASSQPPLFFSPPEGGAVSRLLKPVAQAFGYAIRLRGDAAMREFSRCDGFLVCGGGYLYSSPAPILSRQLWLHALNILAAIRTGKPVLPFPQS